MLYRRLTRAPFNPAASQCGSNQAGVKGQVHESLIESSPGDQRRVQPLPHPSVATTKTNLCNHPHLMPSGMNGSHQVLSANQASKRRLEQISIRSISCVTVCAFAAVLSWFAAANNLTWQHLRRSGYIQMRRCLWRMQGTEPPSKLTAANMDGGQSG